MSDSIIAHAEYSDIAQSDFNQRKWLSSREVAAYLGKFTKFGNPSLGAVRNMVYRKQIIPYKPFGNRGKSYFRRSEIDRLLSFSRKRE